MKPTFTCNGFVAVCDFVRPPTSVGFAAHAADGLRAAKRPCSPKTSLIAHAKNGYTRGRSCFFCENKFTPAVKREKIVFGSFYIQNEIICFQIRIAPFNFFAVNDFGLKAIWAIVARFHIPIHLTFD